MPSARVRLGIVSTSSRSRSRVRVRIPIPLYLLLLFLLSGFFFLSLPFLTLSFWVWTIGRLLRDFMCAVFLLFESISKMFPLKKTKLKKGSRHVQAALRQQKFVWPRAERMAEIIILSALHECSKCSFFCVLKQTSKAILKALFSVV